MVNRRKGVPALPGEDLGPAMLKLDERARQFVLLRVHGRLNPTQAAGKAGYACGTTDLYLRVQGHRLMRQKAVIAAIREEAEKKFGVAASLALSGLSDMVESKNERIRAAAIDSVLDRSGFSRRTQQDIRVEHTDTRSTADLLAAVQRMAQIVDVTPKRIEDGSASKES